MCGRGFEQQEQHPGSWLAPHSCADRSGAALHTVTGCSCPPVPSMPFYFFDWYLTKLHTSIPKDWGPLFLLCQTSTLRQLPGTPVWDFLQRVWGSSRPNPTEQRAFPTLSYQRTSAPAQCHCHLVKLTPLGGAKKVLSYPRTPTCHHLNVSQWHFLLFPQISRVWIWDMGCKHNSQSKLRLHW